MPGPVSVTARTALPSRVPTGVHSAEDGTNLPLLLARSRHSSVRSVERQTRLGPEAVARYGAQIDPARRRQ